jgi:hypothetical protein
MIVGAIQESPAATDAHRRKTAGPAIVYLCYYRPPMVRQPDGLFLVLFLLVILHKNDVDSFRK